MLRTALIALAIAMPAAAMAQQDHSAEMKAHETFVQSLIDKRASLHLTNAQVTKLKTFKSKMVAHHKTMMAGMKNSKHDMAGMKHDSMDHKMMMGMSHDTTMKHEMNMNDPMHKELMAIFTPAQRKKVEALMQEHMKQCGMEAEGQCKVQ